MRDCLGVSILIIVKITNEASSDISSFTVPHYCRIRAISDNFYPTRNFAHYCSIEFLKTQLCLWSLIRSDYIFIHKMSSSDFFVSPIHLIGDMKNILDTFLWEMFSLFHQKYDFSQGEKIKFFLCLKWVFRKEWNDNITEMFEFSDSKLWSCIMIFTDNTAAKKWFELIKKLYITFVLNNTKFWEDLKSCCHFVVFVDADIKSSFSIYETDHPMWVYIFHRIWLLWILNM